MRLLLSFLLLLPPCKAQTPLSSMFHRGDDEQLRNVALPKGGRRRRSDTQREECLSVPVSRGSKEKSCKRRKSSNSTEDISEEPSEEEDSATTTITDAWGGSLGVPQLLKGPRNAILDRLEKARDYWDHTVMMDETYKIVRDKCRNLHPDCALRAVSGECDGDDWWDMYTECGPVCNTCEYLHVEARCAIDPNVKHALYPGDLDRLFRRITTDPIFNPYNVTVLSRPSYPPGENALNSDYTLGPWVVKLDDFVSEKEAKVLIASGEDVGGYERSTEVGDSMEDGSHESKTSSGRTSTNAWCFWDGCENKTLVQAVLSRIENLTGIHRNYSEPLQLLRYEPGQFYNEHHDYIEYDRTRMGGVRIITVFLYLNDVEEGGGTRFTNLDITVMPRRGSVVLWPSVLDEDPHEWDDRTHHEALPVIKGIKYGANAWIHQRHKKVAIDNDCS